ncbi:hypothetical protein D9M68_660160 [compost metagenome]
MRLPRGYYTPGFIAALAAFLCHSKVAPGNFVCENQDNQGYLSAVGLSRALWNHDDYPHERRNSGTNYAPLTALASQDEVDDATAQINSCLRSMAAQDHGGYGQSPAFKELLHVVGELHDNVWSHGMNTGFSTAQRRQCPGGGEYMIEFSLADCGLGFLAELRRSKIQGVNTHRDAIEWCIQEGNSSKLAPQEDEWAQSVPDDFIGQSPFGTASLLQNSGGNHHQGLGLAKLVDLARNYAGDLYLASGDCVLHICNGTITYRSLPCEWKGVAISLAIKETSLRAATRAAEAEDVDEIMRLLRG